MTKFIKYSTAFLLMLIVSTVLLLAITSIAVAQDGEDGEGEDIPPIPDFPRAILEEQAKVVIIASVGGTTEPPYGEYIYPNQTKFEIKATPNAGFRFLYWVISGEYLPGHNLPPIITPIPVDGGEEGEESLPRFLPPSEAAADSLVTSQNPLDVVHGYGYTYQYQPVFVPTSAPGTPVAGTVVVLDAVGGAVNPGGGTYTYAGDSIVTLTATPDSGFQFDHWVVSGGPMPGHGDIENSMTTDNPLTTHAVNGETYNYQPVFSPAGAAPSEGIPAEYLYAIIIILVIIAVIGLGAALMYRGKSK